MRTFSFLFLFLFLASCGKGGGGGSSNGGLAEISDAELTSEAVPVQAQTFEVDANLSGFEREQEEKIYQAIDLIKEVVASPEFKKMVLNKTYKGKKQYFDNGGLTNAQIYKKILKGSEVLNPGDDNTMNLNLSSYFTKDPVIGYTKPSISTVYLNRRYLSQRSFSVNEVAMNLTHEWLHKLGFKHSVKKTPARSHSVPYAVGYIMRQLAKKHI